MCTFATRKQKQKTKNFAKYNINGCPLRGKYLYPNRKCFIVEIDR